MFENILPFLYYNFELHLSKFHFTTMCLKAHIVSSDLDINI